MKTSKVQRHEDNYPIFEVMTEYPNGTNVRQQQEPDVRGWG